MNVAPALSVEFLAASAWWEDRGGTAPKTFEKEEDLRKFVAETPGAIGFVDSANADASVAVIPVT